MKTAATMTEYQVKKTVRERDQNRCVRCGKTKAQQQRETGKNLEVHRIKPGSKYTVDGCELLCHICHWRQKRSPFYVIMKNEKFGRPRYYRPTGCGGADRCNLAVAKREGLRLTAEDRLRVFKAVQNYRAYMHVVRSALHYQI